MKLSSVSIAAFLGTAYASPVAPCLKSDDLAARGLVNLVTYVAKNGLPNPTKCNLATVAVRREWSKLLPDEKSDYIKAVNCLAESPAKTPEGIAAGAKNRYDDFVATHINQTLFIHGTGNFLSWHRYFTWSYEQVLRNECGYKGYQPYYNWPKWADDPLKSPALDGSQLSLSGDGETVSGRDDLCIPSPGACGIRLPPANGGGCVTSGPFQNWSVNLGPVSPSLKVNANPEKSGLGYNPRCLRRDINKVASGWTNDDYTSSLIQNSDNFLNFSTTMQGDFTAGQMGVHTGGHFTVGGDPGGDLFASPGDPFFFLHHAMIDRVYWTWQNQDLDNRQYALGGTITLNNMPPSRDTTLNDTLDLGFVGTPVVTIKDASNTIAGPFCYIYV